MCFENELDFWDILTQTDFRNRLARNSQACLLSAAAAAPNAFRDGYDRDDMFASILITFTK
jgi:hypothetical protein